MYTSTFQSLFDDVEHSLLERHELMKLPTVVDQFVEMLREEGAGNSTYRTEKVKCHLREHFGSKISFYQPDTLGEPGIVHGSNVGLPRLAELWNKSAALSTTESDSQSAGSTDVEFIAEHQQLQHGPTVLDVCHSALLSWSDLKSVRDSMPWPASPEDMDLDAEVNVPPSL